ncbi:hypothetical protein DL765_008772 [Monosporascus sp. GIB2]|nr:hypothetical protein DL765_008772 [Monosporascus sp. GIB2]
MDFSRLAAVSYDDPDRPGQRLIRVYYQVGSHIRESCYDTDNGWYVRGDNIVANHAKPRSPIAVTNLAQGKKTSVFFLAEDNQLCRRVRTTSKAGDRGVWTDGPIVQPTVAISASSQLTAVRTDNEENIRLYYQSTDNMVRGMVSYGDDGSWQPSDLELDKVLPGTSLCAISGDGQVRLFYQADDKTVKERYSDPSTEWKPSRVRSWTADNKAPITAVAWNYSTNKFAIRVYTVQNGILVELVFDQSRGGWSQNPVVTAETIPNIPGMDQPASCAATTQDNQGKLTIFYQPSKQVIAQYDSVAKRVPLGISTARD